MTLPTAFAAGIPGCALKAPHAAKSSSRARIAARASQPGTQRPQYDIKSAPDNAIVPENLLGFHTSDVDQAASSGPAKAYTVYSVRLRTAPGRGASQSDPHSGVWLGLQGTNGQCFLHRVSPMNDPEDAAKEVAEICSLVGSVDGADCVSAIAAAEVAELHRRQKRAESSNRPRRRFLESSIDEVSFAGPDVGPLAALLVGVEAGSWELDEITVSNSRAKHTDRFVCRGLIGKGRWSSGAAPAVQLLPVPAGSVVYGGKALAPEDAEERYRKGMEGYEDLKARSMVGTGALVLGGTLIAGIGGGVSSALPFFAGGVLGGVYQKMLAGQVDAVGAGVGAYGAARGSGSPVGRWGLLGASAVGSTVLLERAVGSGATDTAGALTALLLGMTGFLQFKVALLISAMAQPQEADEPAASGAVLSAGGDGAEATGTAGEAVAGSEGPLGGQQSPGTDADVGSRGQIQSDSSGMDS